MDEGLTPTQAAYGLLTGLERGEFLITSDAIGDFLRSGMQGASPTNNWIFDFFQALVGWIVFPIIRWYADSIVKSAKKNIQIKSQSKKSE